MNKKGVTDNLLFWYIAYTTFVIIPFVIILVWVVGFQDGAATWEDFYAKEIARIINTAEEGEIVYLDVTSGSATGFRRHVPKQQMFRLDQEKKFVIVQFSQRSATQFYYLKNITIESIELYTPSGSEESNQLFIKFGGVP